jgi:hypothetical protein
LSALTAPGLLAADVFAHPTTQFALQTTGAATARQRPPVQEETAVSLSPAYLCRIQPDMLLWQGETVYALPPDQIQTAWLQAAAPGAPLMDDQERVIAWETKVDVDREAETAVWPHLIGANFNNQWCLLAFDLEPAHSHLPGSELQLVLYWQRLSEIATDYHLEITLEDSQGEKWTIPAIPQWDSSPDFGAVGRQSYHLTLPETAVFPGKFRFRLNLFDPTTHEVAPLMDSFNLPYTSPAVTDYATLGQQGIEEESGVQPAAFTFGDPPLFRLVGLKTDAEDLTLYWQSLRPADKNYSVFLHLLDESGKLAAQHDGEPGNGRLPTSMWLPGEILGDLHPLTLPDAGLYNLAVGVYDWQTGQRLPVTDALGQRLPDDQAVLEP